MEPESSIVSITFGGGGFATRLSRGACDGTWAQVASAKPPASAPAMARITVAAESFFVFMRAPLAASGHVDRGLQPDHRPGRGCVVAVVPVVGAEAARRDGVDRGVRRT